MGSCFEHFSWRMRRGLGFRERRGVFTCELSEDVLGWIGTFHPSTKGNSKDPSVGVRFRPLEQLIADCCGEPMHAYKPPTVARPLSSLTGGLPVSDAEDEALAEAMVASIETHALPFLRSIRDLDDLRTELARKTSSDLDVACRRSAAAFLAGDLGAARVELDAAAAIYGVMSDHYWRPFSRFEAALRSRMLA
jgi:hypothetical protein